jgi:hypothetical protein
MLRFYRIKNFQIKNIQMDIFYYSNYCKHSQRVLQFLVKGDLVDKISFICIDKRFHDKRTNQIKIALENGTSVILPPNVHSVPALLLVNQNYHLVLGDDIINHYEPVVREKVAHADMGNGEPSGFAMGQFAGTNTANITSEQFTFYNMSPEELSAKGNSARRPLYNYASVHNEPQFIQTPPNTYKPDKIPNGVSIDSLEQQRNNDIQPSSLFIPSI